MVNIWHEDRKEEFEKIDNLTQEAHRKYLEHLNNKPEKLNLKKVRLKVEEEDLQKKPKLMEENLDKPLNKNIDEITQIPIENNENLNKEGIKLHGDHLAKCQTIFKNEVE